MVVRLRGRLDGGAARADTLAIDNELRAPIASVDTDANPRRFVAGGLTVLLAAETVYAGGSEASLAAGARVEVHGLRNAVAQLHASRIEFVDPAQGLDELRATVADLDLAQQRFNLNGSVTVRFDRASFMPVGAHAADLADGTLVEVRGTLTGSEFSAVEVAIKALDDRAFAGASGERQDVEGHVAGFTGHPGGFSIGGRAVATSEQTQFEGGTAADLANDVRVEARGMIDPQGVLVLSEVEFKSVRLRLHGRATAVYPLLRTLVVLGQAVRQNDVTRVDARTAGGQPSNRLTDIVAGTDCVEIRAYAAGRILFADEIAERVSCGDDLVQAPVTASDATAFSLGFFGSLTADLAGSTVAFRDAAGNPITRTQFFAALAPPRPGVAGSLVRVRGGFNAGVLTGTEAALAEPSHDRAAALAARITAPDSAAPFERAAVAPRPINRLTHRP